MLGMGLTFRKKLFKNKLLLTTLLPRLPIIRYLTSQRTEYLPRLTRRILEQLLRRKNKRSGERKLRKRPKPARKRKEQRKEQDTIWREDSGEKVAKFRRTKDLDLFAVD
jgi:hypothetical protein